MKRILLLALLLTGCGDNGRLATELPIVKETVEVARPCPVALPPRPTPIGTLPDQLVALAATLGAKLKDYAAPGGYADQAEAAIRTCQRAGG